MPHASFTSPTGGEQVTFELNGVTYHCLPVDLLPGGLQLDMAGGGVPTGPEAARRVGDFLEAVLVEDEIELFAAAIRSKNPPVPLSTLDAIMEYLVECYTGRPITSPSGSGNGLAPTARRSMDSASGEVSTSMPSPPIAS